MADETPGAQALMQTDLGQLGGLARACFATHDDDRMGGDGSGDVVPAG